VIPSSHLFLTSTLDIRVAGRDCRHVATRGYVSTDLSADDHVERRREGARTVLVIVGATEMAGGYTLPTTPKIQSELISHSRSRRFRVTNSVRLQMIEIDSSISLVHNAARIRLVADFPGC
jgi:hypothetical protein